MLGLISYLSGLKSDSSAILNGVFRSMLVPLAGVLFLLLIVFVFGRLGLGVVISEPAAYYQ